MPEKLRTAGVLALRFLYLTRYSWMLAVILVALPPLALVAAPALLENLFVLDQPIQMLHVSWLTMFCATSMITTLHITTLNAIDRFDDYRSACEEFQTAWGTSEGASTSWYRRVDAWLMLILGIAACLGMWYVTMSACIHRTAADPGDAWMSVTAGDLSESAVTRAAWREAGLGLAATTGALAVMYLLLWLRRTCFCVKPVDSRSFYFCADSDSHCHPEAEIRRQPFYEVAAWILGPGYLRAVVHRRGAKLVEKIVLAPGHAGLLLCTAVFGLWYAWTYLDGLRHGVVLDETSPFPALFYGLLSLQLIVLLLPGIAFLLDRHRIPVLPAILLSMAGLYGAFGTDHYYELNPSPASVESYSPPTWDELLADRQFLRDAEGKRTLIVVDASGGGIQASAWTAQVLTGLHERYGEPFSRSIGLISSVSGGSVGTIFYLTNRADLREDFDSQLSTSVLPPEAINRIRSASRASGLEATCWGIAYPDTLRAVFPLLASATIDRGWSIEQNWRERMDRAGRDYGDMRLSQLGERLRGGTLPVPVLNATLVETGQRLMISPVLSPRSSGERLGGGIEFAQCFPESHLRLSTAARLSATFPYVTPVARPLGSIGEPDPEGTRQLLTTLHVADGAYVDNEGAVTSVDWINRLLVHYSRPENIEHRPFDRVLLIRIQAFPRELASEPRAANTFSGWRSALLGPFDAMMHVRSASQTERGDLEINLLTRATLAELKAAKERTDRDFQAALAQVDQLESIHDDLRQLAARTPGGNADIDRQFIETDDKLRMTKLLLRESQQRQRKLNELQVESVMFDFHPVDGVRVPMSWKLTGRQQRQIDHAWEDLTEGLHPEDPIGFTDKYFLHTRPKERFAER